MKINSDEFCYLSQSTSFLSWLHATNEKLYSGLIEHLKKAAGCKSNKQKMLETLQEIRKHRDQVKLLEQFLRRHYPGIIISDTAAPASPNLNKHKVFEHYDPGLVTYPRRLIVLASDVGDLEVTVLDFCAQQAHCEHIIIEDRAYIEFLPAEHLSLISKIPDKNWMIRRYKRR